MASAALFAMHSTIAQSATIEFRYQGQDFCEPLSFAGPCGTVFEGSNFTGSLSIDSTLFPFDRVANTAIRIEYDLITVPIEGPGNGFRESDIITRSIIKDDGTSTASLSGSAEGSAVSNFSSDPRFSFLSFDGIISEALFGIVISSPSSVYLEIGSDLSIDTWRIDSGFQGGSNDFVSSPSGDIFSSGVRSIGPGSWTTFVDGVPVAPIPLPATGWLLLSCLGGLSLRKMSKRRAGSHLPFRT